MNVVKNKRTFLQLWLYGHYLCIGLCAALCTSSAAFAQETTSVQIDDQTPVMVQSELPTTAEVKSGSAVGLASSVGLASYYAAKFHGRRTASGETFHAKSMTAAHRTLPFGTKLKVTNLQNQKFVIVRVNDRGPHVPGRIVDLSRTAAELLGMRHTGTARVKLEVLKH